jgi:nicotinamide N-methyltransferase
MIQTLEAYPTNIIAQGFLWGAAFEQLTSHLPVGDRSGFHVLVLADVVFNHSEHAKLVQSIKDTLRQDGTAFVWFSPYRPWLLEKDLAFFPLAEANGLVVEKMFEKVMAKPLFENDPGASCIPLYEFGHSNLDDRMKPSERPSSPTSLLGNKQRSSKYEQEHSVVCRLIPSN